MDAMLRTLILLVTHLSMLGAGIGLALITVRGRRQALEARAAALDTHEMFLELRGAREQRLRAHAANPASGRHRARPVPALTAPMPAALGSDLPPPTLLTASLSQATALLATQRAQRIQQRREFTDLMTRLVGPARIRQHVVAYAQVS